MQLNHWTARVRLLCGFKFAVEYLIAQEKQKAEEAATVSQVIDSGTIFIRDADGNIIVNHSY